MRAGYWVIGGVVLLLGITARLYTAHQDSTFDMESYRIVAEIVQRGGNVYAETDRYNYGAPWFVILGVIGQLSATSADPHTTFRMSIALLLTLVDIALYGMVTRRYGLRAGMLFFLNPISILVTGTHSQFDNLALLWGVLAILLYGETPTEKLTRRHYAALLLLGFALSIKHVLLLFPLWLAVREPTFRRKVIVLLLPLAVFIGGLLPFWHANIWTQVFFYSSFRNTPFIQYVLPRGLYEALRFTDNGVWLASWALFVGMLSVGALVCRRWRTLDALLAYTLLLALFTPAMANQYAAIPVMALAVFVNPLYLAYSLLMGWHMLADAPNLFARIGIAAASRDLRDWLVIVLAAGVLWQAYSAQLRVLVGQMLGWLEREITAQLPVFRQKQACWWFGIVALIGMGSGLLVLRPTVPSDTTVRLEGNFAQTWLMANLTTYQSDYAAQGTLTLGIEWTFLQSATPQEVVFLLLNAQTQQIESKQHFPLPAGVAATTRHERYTIRLPNVDVTTSYTVFAGLYDPVNEVALPLESALTVVQGDALRVTAVQVRAGAPRGQLPALATWQATIALTQYRCLLADGQLRLTLAWQMQQRLSAETRFFVHVFAVDETLLAQFDGRLSDEHPLDGLPPLARLTTDYTFPAMPQEVIVRFGFYRLPDRERLNVISAQLPVENAMIRLGCKL
jgi:hypothetical protein